MMSVWNEEYEDPSEGMYDEVNGSVLGEVDISTLSLIPSGWESSR